MSVRLTPILLVAALAIALASAACTSSPAADPVAPADTPVATPADTPEPVVVKPEPTGDAAELAALLGLEDVLAVIGDDVALTVKLVDQQAIDDSEAPVPVDAIEKWGVVVFQSPGAGPAIVFSVMALVTEQDAQTVFFNAEREMSQQSVFTDLGGYHVAVEPNESGLGSLIMFVRGDRVITLSATLPSAGEPLTDLAGLTSLAKTVSQRLGRELNAGHQTELDAARALWESVDGSEYSFEFNWVCFCLREWVAPVRLTVSGGEVVSAVFVESGEPVTDASQFDFYETIGGLFDQIQDAIDRAAESIRVEYHPTEGYPISSFIDYDARIADEERGFNASGLSVNQGD